jgi:hypothetical protein
MFDGAKMKMVILQNRYKWIALYFVLALIPLTRANGKPKGRCGSWLLVLSTCWTGSSERAPSGWYLALAYSREALEAKQSLLGAGLWGPWLAGAKHDSFGEIRLDIGRERIRIRKSEDTLIT